MMATTQLLLIKDIDRSKMQVRERSDPKGVGEYATAMQALKERRAAGDYIAPSEEFPPVIAYLVDGETYHLVDGYHRTEAAELIGETDIDADVRTGSFADAMDFALAANLKHGLQMTRADKRHAVGMALQAFSGMSDRVIAEKCGVSHTTVASVKAELIQLAKLASSETVTSKNGKQYPAGKAKLTPKSKPDLKLHAEPAADDEPANVNQIELEMDEAEQAQSNKQQIEQPQVKPGHELVSTAWRKKTLAAYGVLLRLIDKQPGLAEQVDELLYALFAAIESYGDEEA